MKFPYKTSIYTNPITSQRDIIYRPFVPIDVAYNGRWLSDITEGGIKNIDALIDSGADQNLAPMDLAVLLGVQFINVKIHKIFGVDGRAVETYPAPVSIRIGRHAYDTLIFFADRIPEILLGGQGFFDRWKVTFQYAKQIKIS